ncbi:hypothetical protein CQA53_11175 [Helicobacter didelphidarum]|uniref:Beta-lactamase n=1 Tax=Helicobacter didelphidarum TaxID=2040648 RepID=A0A3D8I3Z9_9HELI|nr:tetratricopeptide repeat protein [Helicobacter didelphidarum]RDU59890.1 hypothetical protein CQA53_11175 [Helicobacter didelphidarum]
MVSFYRFLLCFICFAYLLWANPNGITNKSHGNSNNTSTQNEQEFLLKSKKYKSKSTQDLLHSFNKCAYGEISSCETIISYGIRNSEECFPKECAIIGALLIAVNKNEEAITYLQKACYNHEHSSCMNLGLIYQERQDYINAKAYYADACKMKDNLACYNLGLLYTDEKMLGKKNALAIEYFQQACARFHAKACFNIAVIHANSIKQDLPKAKFYFDKACDLGLEKACENIQNLKETPMPTPQKHRGLYLIDI